VKVFFGVQWPLKTKISKEKNSAARRSRSCKKQRDSGPERERERGVPTNKHWKAPLDDDEDDDDCLSST
jgi:hypothetical protein